MTSWYEQIASAVAATRILGPCSVSWFGQSSPPLAKRIEAAMSADLRRRYLVEHLTSQLYADFYCQGQPVPSQPGGISAETRFTEFVQALSQANAGRGSGETGWHVDRMDGQLAVASRGGLSLWIGASDVVEDGRLTPGQMVTVRMPKELLKISPGFYMALGERDLSFEQAVIRWYWNLCSYGGEALIGEVTSRLNLAEIPFRVKVANTPDGYRRCDAGVLYTPLELFDTVAALVTRIHANLAFALDAGTPVFTKQLAPGLAVAEDPSGGGQSFGWSRCRLVAEGIVRAHEEGYADARATEVVRSCFVEAGLDLEAPFLNPGSTDRYALPAQ